MLSSWKKLCGKPRKTGNGGMNTGSFSEKRGSDMWIREYQGPDCKILAKLFYDTVHRVNARDYTEEQLDVWATGWVDLEEWDRSFREHYSIVAVWGDVVVGFGDIDRTGYLDRLYVHADYQGRGVATAICNRLEQEIPGNIITHASVTARPFLKKEVIG